MTYILKLRLDGTNTYLIDDGHPKGLKSTGDRKLVAFSACFEAEKSYPEARLVSDTIDIDELICWCETEDPVIDTIDRAQDLWDIIDFFDSLEEAGVFDADTICNCRMADASAMKILSANLVFIATLPTLSSAVVGSLVTMFQSAICCLRRALPSSDSLP